MRILIPTTEFPPQPGGVAAVAYEQATGLHRLGHEIVVQALDCGAEKPAIPDEIVIFRQKTRLRAIARLLPLGLRLNRLTKVWKPDFICCPTYRGYGLPVRMIARKHSIPYCIYFHGTEINTETASPARRTILENVLKHARFCATNSSNTRSILQNHFPGLQTPIVAIPPGVDLDRFHGARVEARARDLRAEWLSTLPQLVSLTDPVILLTMCRMVYQKGVDVVIRALAQLSEHSNLLLVVAGGGESLPDFRQLATQTGVADRVIFTGPIPYDQTAAYYAAADIYVQPSQPVGNFLESFGISFVEAQAAGIPCIGTDWGGVPEAVLRDKSAILVPTKNVEAVMRAVADLVSNPELRRTMGTAGKAHADTLSWESHCERLAAEMCSVLGKS